MIIAIIAITATKHKIMPNTNINDNGLVENATIPSSEYLNNFQKFHFVSPAFLSMFSYSNHFFLKPTQLNIPLENLFTSGISKTASHIVLFIIWKSLAPSTISMSDSLLMIL